jgi:serine/threonine-protein kinase RsbT
MVSQSETEVISIEDDSDLVRVCMRVRAVAAAMGFSQLEQTRLMTAASEMARNIRLYAKRGTVEIRQITQSGRSGLCLKFEDRGAGIPDIELAMSDGYSTSRGLGKGLPGARRLVDDFQIHSQVGKGTTVKLIKWLWKMAEQ